MEKGQDEKIKSGYSMEKYGVNPLITVIVPVYKVEKYLKECVDSILKQSYSELEIILVDDGSPDGCGKICDNYAKTDERIRVIHQQNKGLSSARNAGIDIATGQYITFVDSDDWISEDMIEILYQSMKKQKAQMAGCFLESFYDNKRKLSNRYHDQIYIFSRAKALDSFLFNGYLTPCTCGKLYMIDLWKNIRFPEKMFFEDQYTTYKLIDQCDKICFTENPLYHYRKREGSIGHSKFCQTTYQLYDAIHQEYDYINDKYGNFCPNIAVARITWELVFINMMIVANYYDDIVRKDVQKFAKINIRKVWKCEYISILRKVQINLFIFCFPLYVIFYRRYKKKHPLN